MSDGPTEMARAEKQGIKLPVSKGTCYTIGIYDANDRLVTVAANERMCDEIIQALNGYGEAVKACEYAHAFLVDWKDTLANNQMTNEYYEDMSGEKELALVIDRSQR